MRSSSEAPTTKASRTIFRPGGSSILGKAASLLSSSAPLLAIVAAIQTAVAQPNVPPGRDISPFGWENQSPDPFGSRVQGVTAADRRVFEAWRSGLLEQHLAMIAHRVKQNWVQPDDADSNIDCDITLRQSRSGEVLAIHVQCCDGGDDEIVRSIKAAVRRASPLPLQPDPTLFQGTLEFRFMPDPPPEDIDTDLISSKCRDWRMPGSSD